MARYLLGLAHNTSSLAHMGDPLASCCLAQAGEGLNTGAYLLRLSSP